MKILAMLVRRAPARVSRNELIDTIWRGNYLAGEKGVRQAIWSIRLALGDNAAEPVFIRTIPRLGYQWLGRSLAQTTAGSDVAAGQSAPRRSLGAFAATALLLVLAVSNWSPTKFFTQRDEHRVARADLRDNSIVVDYTTGCRRILIPNDHDLLVGSPIISADRRQVVFRVQKDGNCRMISFEPESDRVRKFNRCPDVRT